MCVAQLTLTYGCAAMTAAPAFVSSEATKAMLAKRGRASYTGERSIGTLDAGAIAVAIMFEKVADAWVADE